MQDIGLWSKLWMQLLNKYQKQFHMLDVYFRVKLDEKKEFLAIIATLQMPRDYLEAIQK